jgi:hypothetical protein
MPRGPLAEDWLFWDPETIFAYPHSCERDAQSDDAGGREPEQLDLFEQPVGGGPG